MSLSSSAAITITCVRCSGEFVMSIAGRSAEETAKLARTYLCRTCRKPVTDEQVEELERAGLR